MFFGLLNAHSFCENGSELSCSVKAEISWLAGHVRSCSMEVFVQHGKLEQNITHCPDVMQAYHYHCIIEVTCSLSDLLVHFFLCS